MIFFFASSVQRWSIFSPTRLTTPSTPSKAAAGGRSRVGSQACQATPRLGAARPARVAAEADDLVAAGQQRVTQRRADQAAGSGDEDLHELEPGTSTVAKVPVSSLRRAMPSRLASSTTASATFGATSRLKTLGMM